MIFNFKKSDIEILYELARAAWNLEPEKLKSKDRHEPLSTARNIIAAIGVNELKLPHEMVAKALSRVRSNITYLSMMHEARYSKEHDPLYFENYNEALAVLEGIQDNEL